MYRPIRNLVPRHWSRAARHAARHEVPIDHLPPLGSATVTPLAERRRQRTTIGINGTRSG
jgi:hypothetical protein